MTTVKYNDSNPYFTCIPFSSVFLSPFLLLILCLCSIFCSAIQIFELELLPTNRLLSLNHDMTNKSEENNCWKEGKNRKWIQQSINCNISSGKTKQILSLILFFPQNYRDNKVFTRWNDFFLQANSSSLIIETLRIRYKLTVSQSFFIEWTTNIVTCRQINNE